MDKYLRLPDKTRIAHEILTYLIDHPDAQDTFEGIVQWWLLERKIKYHMAVVREAIAELVGKGLLIEHGKEDSRVHYRTNLDKYEEILTLLADSANSDQ